MERPARQRAGWLALARQGDASARGPLLAILNNETNAYWQAVAAGLLDQWVGDPAVRDGLAKALTHPHPLVRATAVRALEPLAEETGSTLAGEFRKLLADPSRNVRIAAAWALRAELDTNSPAGRELLHFLDFNADQPSGQMQQGAFYFSRGDLAGGAGAFSAGGGLGHQFRAAPPGIAVALSAANRNPEAIEQLTAACRLAPREASYYYELGLA